MRAIQQNSGRVRRQSYGPELYKTRLLGQVYADAEFFVQIVKLSAEFGTPALVVAFLVYARPILLKWHELKKDRSIEIQQGDAIVRIEGRNDIDEALKVFKELTSSAPENGS